MSFQVDKTHRKNSSKASLSIKLSYVLLESLSIHIGSGGPVSGHKNIAPFNVDMEAFNEFCQLENSSNG